MSLNCEITALLFFLFVFFKVSICYFKVLEFQLHMGSIVCLGLRLQSADKCLGLTYKDAGVDIVAGSELVQRIGKMAL